jgi:hypothetical protein
VLGTAVLWQSSLSKHCAEKSWHSPCARGSSRLQSWRHAVEDRATVRDFSLERTEGAGGQCVEKRGVVTLSDRLIGQRLEVYQPREAQKKYSAHCMAASGGAHVCCAGVRNGMTTAATSATWRLKWDIAERKARKRLRVTR